MIGGGEARAGSLHLADVRAPALPPVTGVAERRRVARFSDGAYLTRPEHPRHAMPRCIVMGAERGWARPRGRPARGRGLGHQSTLAGFHRSAPVEQSSPAVRGRPVQ